jgi:hypothetical protein
VDDAPEVERGLLAAADGVLDVEQRLPAGGHECPAVGAGQRAVPGERHGLPVVVQVGALEDQAVLVWAQPQALLREPGQELGPVAGGRERPAPVAARADDMGM